MTAIDLKKVYLQEANAATQASEQGMADLLKPILESENPKIKGFVACIRALNADDSPHKLNLTAKPLSYSGSTTVGAYLTVQLEDKLGVKGTEYYFRVTPKPIHSGEEVGVAGYTKRDHTGKEIESGTRGDMGGINFATDEGVKEFIKRIVADHTKAVRRTADGNSANRFFSQSNG